MTVRFHKTRVRAMENNKELPVRVIGAEVIADDKVLVTCEIDVDVARLMNLKNIKYNLSVKEVDGL